MSAMPPACHMIPIGKRPLLSGANIGYACAFVGFFHGAIGGTDHVPVVSGDGPVLLRPDLAGVGSVFIASAKKIALFIEQLYWSSRRSSCQYDGESDEGIGISDPGHSSKH